MTWDGVPFQDSNDPTHHSWAYVPAPAISYVDFDRSPGTASDIGPANFGGSIHMFSPKLSDNMLIPRIGVVRIVQHERVPGPVQLGAVRGAQSQGQLLSSRVIYMTSDGYQTNNFQVRTAATAKFVYKFSDKT